MAIAAPSKCRTARKNSPIPEPMLPPRPLQIDGNDDDDEMFAQPLMDPSSMKEAEWKMIGLWGWDWDWVGLDWGISQDWKPSDCFVPRELQFEAAPRQVKYYQFKRTLTMTG